MAVVELIKFSQYYSLNSSLLESVLETVCERFCQEFLQSSLESSTSGEENDVRKIMVEVMTSYSQMKLPKLKSRAFDSRIIERIWEANRDQYSHLFFQRSLSGILERRLDKMNFTDADLFTKTLRDLDQEIEG